MPNHACRPIFSHLTHKCEPFKAFSGPFEKSGKSIQFEKGIFQVNHALIPGSPILKGKSVKYWSFSGDPKHIVKQQNFGILQNMIPLAQKKLAGITFTHCLSCVIIIPFGLHVVITLRATVTFGIML